MSQETPWVGEVVPAPPEPVVDYGSFDLEQLRCPKCQGGVGEMGSCHTWSRTDTEGRQQWMHCQGCYTATYFYCEGVAPDYEGCDWSYEWGLNPRNPRTESNESDRPTGSEWNFLNKQHPG